MSKDKNKAAAGTAVLESFEPDGEAPRDNYRVKLEAFEGPLDLLLYLIRKNEVDIYNIPIAEITPMQCLDALRYLEKRPGRHGRSRNETVGRVRETMRRVFRLAVNTSRANFDRPTTRSTGA